MSIIIDILVIALSCITVWFAARRGFVEMFIRTVGFVLAFAIASAISPMVSDAIYDNFIEPQATTQISALVKTGSNAAAQSAEDAVDQVYDAMPDYLVSYLESTDLKRDAAVTAISDLTAQNGGELAESISQTIVRPVATSLLRSISFIVILAILMLVVRILSRFLRGVKRIPLVRNVNAFLGGVLGIFKAVLIIYILAIAAQLFVICTGNANAVLNEEIIHSTYLFNIFYKYNPLTLL